jgi:hypothetical protein
MEGQFSLHTLEGHIQNSALVFSLQAHYNAQQHAEEFVVELLVSLDRMQVLVQNLVAIEVSSTTSLVKLWSWEPCPASKEPPCLCIQAWKEKVLPHLRHHLAHQVDKVVSYMVLYHEVNLANLLEVCWLVHLFAPGCMKHHLDARLTMTSA